MTTFAVLRVRGPAVRIAVQGHPTLEHDGVRESLWTVALEKEAFDRFTLGLLQSGIQFDVQVATEPNPPKGGYHACQFCAFFDPLSDTQCGFTDWDEGTRRQMAATPDGQGSLARCPDRLG